MLFNQIRYIVVPILASLGFQLDDAGFQLDDVAEKGNTVVAAKGEALRLTRNTDSRT